MHLENASLCPFLKSILGIYSENAVAEVVRDCNHTEINRKLLLTDLQWGEGVLEQSVFIHTF